MSLYYQDDYVTLYHGDCLTDHREWLDADVLVTDPPYGVAVRTGRTVGAGADGRREHAAKLREAGVHRIKNDGDTKVRDAVVEAWGDRPAIVFGSWRKPRPENTRQRLLWVKAAPGTGMARGDIQPWISKDEEIYILGNPARFAHARVDSNVYITTEHRGAEVRRIGHPTPKPLDLMEKLVDKCPTGLIADPFAGSGSTLIAARNLGRNAIGVELEERYCEIIAKRLDQQVIDFEALM